MFDVTWPGLPRLWERDASSLDDGDCIPNIVGGVAAAQGSELRCRRLYPCRSGRTAQTVILGGRAVAVEPSRTAGLAFFVLTRGILMGYRGSEIDFEFRLTDSQ